MSSSTQIVALPDTLVFPNDALGAVHAALLEHDADLCLGVFPVDEPERLGPVDLAPDGTVRRVLDKPGHRELPNSWGVACWSPAFTAFCCEWDEARVREGATTERVLGHVFDAARVAGLRVRGVFFPTGHMIDIGTPAGLALAQRELDR